MFPSAGGEFGKRNWQAEIAWLSGRYPAFSRCRRATWVSANLNCTFRPFRPPAKAAHMTKGHQEQLSPREHLDGTEHDLAAIAGELTATEPAAR